MKQFCLVILLTACVTPVFAQQQPQPLGPPIGPPAPPVQGSVAPIESIRRPPPLPLMVQRPTARAQPFDRVMYVLDVSCSMTSKLQEAITVIDTFCSDGFKATAVTFTETHQRWNGVAVPCKHPRAAPHTDKCLEPGWAWMPMHRREMFAHLNAFSGSGGTNPTSALDYAIKNAPDRTLIVFISDGEFAHVDSGAEGDENRQPGPLSAVRSAQAWRRNRKLAPVQMLVWATSEADSKRESLVQLARLGGGGLWRADTRRSGPW